MVRSGVLEIDYTAASGPFQTGKNEPSLPQLGQATREMLQPVTTTAQGDLIFLGVVSQSAPRVYVVYLQISCASAALTPPYVPLEDLSANLRYDSGYLQRLLFRQKQDPSE
jgi:hypothetical protein